MAQEASGAERSFFRVRTRIGLHLRRLGDAEWEAEQHAIIGDRSSADDGIGPELARRLVRLERKLDRILDHLGALDCDRLVRTVPRDVSLSGSGIAFEGEEQLAAGDRVLLVLELDGELPVRIRALGRVVPDQGTDTGHAVEFVVIREVDRDRIIEHTLEIERRRIRQRGSAAEAAT